jgi:esterase FrsA
MSTPRAVEEVKRDIRERVGRRAPFLHADKNEAEEALAKMPNFDGEIWASAWNALGERWEEKARAAERANNAAQAKDDFLKSYGYYGIARHPFPSTPGKHHGYAKTREMFLAASKYFDVPVERVSIPFQAKSIVGHLRLPKKLPAPMILHWGGIDNWKEERHSFGEAFVREGWGCFIIDSPGTGECPLLAGPAAHQVHTAVLDYWLERPEVDTNKIAVVGASFGGHWSTKLAHLAPDKLRAAVNWGGGIHYFFQPEWQERSRHADSYLFDLIEARANLFGKKTFDELCAVMPALSLLDQGLLDKPCAPLLIVNGKEDKQVPLEDFYLLLEHGNPKTIRLFPGGHMGAIPNIFKTVLTWLHDKLDG